MSLKSLHIHNSWTLFLDRDGVINRRLTDDYVKSPDEFDLIPGVAEALRDLSKRFGKIIVVSNQQGIGKGLMTESDLERVHTKMLNLIKNAGGRIDAVFFASSLAHEQNIMRKPNIGMGLAARKKFPEIRFKRSIMAGDSFSDMKFGKRLGMKTVLIGDAVNIARLHPKLVDYHFADLHAFSIALSSS
jgi:histidinol-phosphate phosphatase family protein